jgi:hypothetical protein
MTATTKTNYGKLTAGLIAAWFVIALGASALHLLQGAPGQPPIAILMAVLTPVVVFSIWYGSSKPFREWVLSLNPRTLTLIHAERIGGLVFLAMYTYKLLPGMFALPAGWGDIAIGATAYLAATRLIPNHRRAFIAWQMLGVLDLVVALSMAAVSSLLHPLGITTAPMAELPLSLIPSFGVPLFLILHIICIAQARRWPAAERRRMVHAEGSASA